MSWSCAMVASQLSAASAAVASSRIFPGTDPANANSVGKPRGQELDLGDLL